MIRVVPFGGCDTALRVTKHGRVGYTPALQVSAWTCMDGFLLIISEQLQSGIPNPSDQATRRHAIVVGALERRVPVQLGGQCSPKAVLHLEL